MADNREKDFEKDIEKFFNHFGWASEKFINLSFDIKKGYSPKLFLEFIKTSQPEQWKKLQKVFKFEAEEKLLSNFERQIEDYGLLAVLRNGVKLTRANVRIKTLFIPDDGENGHKKIEKNIFQVVRQFYYDGSNSIDTVLMINGLPIVGIELKTLQTHQTFKDAVKQWKEDRSPSEAIFRFNQRMLVFFAMDPYIINMTTKLEGKETFFLPFNQGSNGAGKVGGAGNPPDIDEYPVHYLWDDVLRPDMLLTIISDYMKLDWKEDKKSKTKKMDKLIFPRYHQLDVVRKLVKDVYVNGTGTNYLIQHSAGSGKSNSIAWLAYSLSHMLNENQDPFFTSVIVITDRRVLDRQLQDTIKSFEQTTSFVETIDVKKGSRGLKQAIEDGRKIIITTLQKFPEIYQELDIRNNARFAIIADEAHSSQTGRSAESLKVGLGDPEEQLRRYAEVEGEEEANKLDFQDELVRSRLASGKQGNLSFFAFTATPKNKTLEMFGIKKDDGKYHPFHVYSMKQAIEEGFILDVLKNYTTYKEAYKMAEKSEEYKKVDAKPSEVKKAILRAKDLHPYVISQKVAIIVEHFREKVVHKINGNAKAMLVTSSRLAAVRYKLEIEKYIKSKGYTDIKTLVAFSGDVIDEGVPSSIIKPFTEPNMNIDPNGKNIKESQTKVVFHEHNEYKVLIVAMKYDTGFDEPLLHTMYVDKKLQGIKAVQTLSRVNRVMKDKNDTFILDFVNNEEDIKKAFQPYYTETDLVNETEDEGLDRLKHKMREYGLYSDEDVESIYELFDIKVGEDLNRERLHSLLLPIQREYLDVPDEETQRNFRYVVRKFVRAYQYTSQLFPLYDLELEKEAVFARVLLPVLELTTGDRVNFVDKVELDSYKIVQDVKEQKIELEDKDGELKVPSIETEPRQEEEKEKLEKILEDINSRFGIGLTSQDKLIVKQLWDEAEKEMMKDKSIISASKNPIQMFTATVVPKFIRLIADYVERNKTVYEKIFDSDEGMNQIAKNFAEDLYTKLHK
jgi:type I restriction enzyme, R subunit